MTTEAVTFLLSLHAQYMDPTNDAGEQELVDLAVQQSLTLDDYYRQPTPCADTTTDPNDWR